MTWFHENECEFDLDLVLVCVETSASASVSYCTNAWYGYPVQKKLCDVSDQRKTRYENLPQNRVGIEQNTLTLNHMQGSVAGFEPVSTVTERWQRFQLFGHHLVHANTFSLVFLAKTSWFLPWSWMIPILYTHTHFYTLTVHKGILTGFLQHLLSIN